MKTITVILTDEEVKCLSDMLNCEMLLDEWGFEQHEIDAIESAIAKIGVELDRTILYCNL